MVSSTETRTSFIMAESHGVTLTQQAIDAARTKGFPNPQDVAGFALSAIATVLRVRALTPGGQVLIRKLTLLLDENGHFHSIWWDDPPSAVGTWQRSLSIELPPTPNTEDVDAEANRLLIELFK